ncbi:MAG: hypothetical protein IIA88_02320 [Bacteroidetes bacterium]|nr:hypothetical protein [Bacteroidota bacterium]
MEILATIAIYSLAVMAVIMIAFPLYLLGGFDFIFRSKKRKSEEVEKV